MKKSPENRTETCCSRRFAPMPIRFRCGYCEAMLGIASRKAGTVITCPKCQGQVIVPCPEGDAEAARAKYQADQETRRLAEEAQRQAQEAAQRQAALLAEQRRRQEEAARQAEAQRQAEEAARRQAAIAEQRWQQGEEARRKSPAQTASRHQQYNLLTHSRPRNQSLTYCWYCKQSKSVYQIQCNYCRCLS